MSHKSWTFTTYEDGKPVATEKHLNHDQALAALRAAIAGEDVIADKSLRTVATADRHESLSPAELGAAAAFARAA
jgi:hypothetical protein